MTQTIGFAAWWGHLNAELKAIGNGPALRLDALERYRAGNTPAAAATLIDLWRKDGAARRANVDEEEARRVLEEAMRDRGPTATLRALEWGLRWTPRSVR